jgi:amino acid adenylation domain-containing protein
MPTLVASSHPTGTFIEFDKAEVESSVPARFEQQVNHYPGRIAVKTVGAELTYQALNRIANGVARAVLSLSAGDDRPVALLFETGPAMIAAMLGALKAGRVWVPLDASDPNDRISFIYGDSQAALILTDGTNRDLAHELARTHGAVLDIDELTPMLSDENPGLSISPDTFAYILYTSGSTGQPKGVVHTHRSILHSVYRYTNSMRLCAEDRLLLLASYSHAAGVTDIFKVLLNGAALFPFDVRVDGFANLGGWAAQQGITLYHSVPTVFRHFVGSLRGDEDLSNIRIVHLGGEPVSGREVHLFKKHFAPGCLLLNNLGATETSVFRQYFMTQEAEFVGNTVPVGYPVEDMDVYLLDEAGQAVGAGETGEIVVQSRYLASGYWGRPELTQMAFQPSAAGGDERVYRTGDLGVMRPDGCLEHLGRRDSQVKIRGNRIELSEVEGAFGELVAIKDVVVDAREDTTGEKRLVAYFVSAVEPGPSVGELRQALSRTLPGYMIPASFVRLDAMPVTPSGKIDRRGLPEPEWERQTTERYVPPGSRLEKAIAEIWQDLLGLDHVGVNDDFFDLGAHSLLIVQAARRVSDVTDRKLTVRDMSRYSTVRALSRYLEQEPENAHQPSLAESPVVKLQDGHFRPALYIVPGNLGNVFRDLGYLARHLGADQPVYGLQDGLGLPSRIPALASHYVDHMVRVQPTGPYYLAGICSGGAIAFEMAQQLLRRGQPVALLASIEPAGPAVPAVRTYSNLLRVLWRRVTQGAGRDRDEISHLDPAAKVLFLRLKLKVVANILAVRFYFPRSYPGHLELFLTKESIERRSQADWRDLAAGGATLHEITGVHRTITGDHATIEESQMQVLGVKLRACIDQALHDSQSVPS